MPQCCFMRKRQGLHATQGQETGERIEDGTDRVLHELEFFGDVLAVLHHDDAANHVRMPVDVLRHRVHDQVNAEVERALHIGRCEGVVNHRQDAALPADVCDLFQVGDLEQRIGRRFHPDHFRIGLDCLLQRAGHIGIGVAGAQVHRALAYFLEQAPGTAVQVVRGHDVAARIQQFQHCSGRRQPGSERESLHSAFEIGDAALECVTRRILRARIFVAGMHARRMLLEGGRRVDRRHHRAGRWDRGLTGVDGSRWRNPACHSVCSFLAFFSAPYCAGG